MRLEKDQKRVLCILVLVGAAFTLGVWLPVHLKNRRINERIDAARKQLGLDRPDAAALTKLAHDVDVLEEAVASLDKHVPEKDELGQLVRELTDVLKAQQVTDHEIQTRPRVAGTDYNTIPVALRFRGSFLSAFGFLNQIESMRRLVRVNRVELDGNPEEVGEPLAVRIELDTFSTAAEATPDEF